MARPGKAIFDVTMMAGWAFAAVLTGLVALTMVDDTGEPATRSSAVATLESDDARLLTGSIRQQKAGARSAQNPLIEKQNETFNPFSQTANSQYDQLQQVLSELRALKREVAAFHVSTKRLRTENNLLKQRLAKLELRDDTREDGVRVVALPRRDDARTPLPLPPHQAAQNGVDDHRMVDRSATGSIAPIPLVPQNEAAFDPFKATNQPKQPQVQVSEEPLNMDITVQGPDGRMMLPKTKPATLRSQTTQATAPVSDETIRPKSEVVEAPEQALASSQTVFGIDLGQFISIADLEGAWNEISISQRPIVGDLKALSRVMRGSRNELVLNLVAGPIQNAAEAASLCAQLKFRGYGCRVSVYQGQALANR